MTRRRWWWKSEKYHSDVGWRSWFTFSVSVWKCSVTDCWWQTVPYCGAAASKTPLSGWGLYLGSWTHPVDADHNRGRPQTLSTKGRCSKPSLWSLKTSHFKTVCKDDNGYISPVKQQNSKRWYYLAAHHQIVNVLKVFSLPSIVCYWTLSEQR